MPCGIFRQDLGHCALGILEIRPLADGGSDLELVRVLACQVLVAALSTLEIGTTQSLTRGGRSGF